MEYMMGSGLILLVVVLCLIQISLLGGLKRQLDEQRKQLDRLARLIGGGDLPAPEAFLSEEAKRRILQLKQEGKPIEAIRDVRKETGMGLKEAKEYVDSL